MTKFKKIKKWLDLNIGWIFVNGRKREWWENHLKEKYKGDI